MDDPITFEAQSFALFDVEQNAVMMTGYGNLAIFNTRNVAQIWADRSGRNVRVVAVTIRPVTEH